MNDPLKENLLIMYDKKLYCIEFCVKGFVRGLLWELIEKSSKETFDSKLVDLSKVDTSNYLAENLDKVVSTIVHTAFEDGPPHEEFPNWDYRSVETNLKKIKDYLYENDRRPRLSI